MLDTITAAVEDYQNKWQTLIATRQNQSFFKDLKPVSIGWKVGDRQEYDALYRELHDSCDRIVETWMNERWIAKMHLHDSQLPGGIQIIKLMQRRPDSTDATGLDHVDFYGPDVVKGEQILRSESDLKWSVESNDVVEGYEWLSVWFDGTEAKLKANTVIDIVVKELQEINERIKKDTE